MFNRTLVKQKVGAPKHNAHTRARRFLLTVVGVMYAPAPAVREALQRVAARVKCGERARAPWCRVDQLEDGRWRVNERE